MLVWTQPRRAWAGITSVVTLALLCTAPLHAVPAPPTMFAPAVAGPQVTLTWSAVAGAQGYRLAIGTAPGQEQYAQVVGNVTTVTFNSPFVGTGYVRAQAYDATGLSAPSNEVALTVTSLTPVPAAPVGLQASLSGTSVGLTWGPGAGGGPPLGVILEAGTAPGQANLGTVILPLSTSATVPNVAAGTYYVRVYAGNASGRSAPSNEVRVDMPVGGGCSAPAAPALTVTTSGSTVTFAWTAVGGVAGYRLDVAAGPTGPIVASQVFGAGTTSLSLGGAPAGTYYSRVISASPCGAQASSAVASFTVSGGGGGGGGGGTGPRAPNPGPGQRLPLPDMSSVVYAVGNAYRGDLLSSCREHGGNNVWLYRLIRELRRYDSRWGLNWKRGNVGDMSQDVVTYNFSADADEGTTNVYIIDVIAGHCGNNPQAAWIDVTDATRNAGTIGRWTLQPYLAAGGTP